MSPIPRLNINIKRRFFDDDYDDDDDDDNFDPLSTWSEKSYNGPGAGYGGPGGSGSDDNPILNGDYGGGEERSNIDLDIDDRIITWDNGMDGGKIAAIVVSIVIFFLIVTGLCLWKDRQRKRRRLLEEQRMANGGVKGDVYMKEQAEELSSMSAVSTQGVIGGTPVQVQGTDTPPPYEPRQPAVAHLAGGQPVAGGSTWRQSRVGTEEDDIMVTDGMPPDSGRQHDGKGSGGLQIGG